MNRSSAPSTVSTVSIGSEVVSTSSSSQRFMSAPFEAAAAAGFSPLCPWIALRFGALESNPGLKVSARRVARNLTMSAMHRAPTARAGSAALLQERLERRQPLLQRIGLGPRLRRQLLDGLEFVAADQVHFRDETVGLGA